MKGFGLKQDAATGRLHWSGGAAIQKVKRGLGSGDALIAISKDGRPRLVRIDDVAQRQSKPARPVFGRLAGRIHVSPDFDATPDEIVTAMEGSV